MSIFEDSLPPMDASASPGLAPLPPEQAGSFQADASPQGPAPVTDLSINAPASVSPNLAASNSGLGLANFKAARSDDDVQYLHNLPTAQKIGLMLQSFGAGVNGQADPIAALLAQKQRREAEFRQELGTTLQTITTGIKAVKGIADPKAKAALIQQITRAAGPNAAIIGEALMSAGTSDEQSVTDIVSVVENPSARALLVKTSMLAEDPKKEALRLMTDADFMKRLETRADQGTLPSVTTKMAVISRAMSNMSQFKAQDGASFTMADLREQNAKLPKELQLTDAEFGTINRNQAALIPYGLKTDKSLQDEQGADLKRKDTGTWSEPYSMGGATVQKNSVTGEIRTAVSRPPREPAGSGEGEGLSAEAIEAAAQRYAVDGTLPPNLGRGAQGAANSAAILNRAAAIAKESGSDGEASRIRQIANKANTSALAQITKQETMVGAFEKNAIKNADIALDASKKANRTGVPVLNRWILAGQKNIAGDPDVSKFHAATETFVNEYAKIMSGSMGNTAVSDSLRKETQSMLATKDTPEQFEAVVNLMKREMANRMKGFAEQRAELTGRMGAPKKDEPAPAPGAPAKAAPAPTNAKGWKLMKDAKGNQAYVSPDGKQYEEVK